MNGLIMEMKKKMSDRIWKVTIIGYVIQKEYMDEPEAWDNFDPLQLDVFADFPELEFKEMVEEVKDNVDS